MSLCNQSHIKLYDYDYVAAKRPRGSHGPTWIYLFCKYTAAYTPFWTSPPAPARRPLSRARTEMAAKPDYDELWAPLFSRSIVGVQVHTSVETWVN